MNAGRNTFFRYLPVSSLDKKWELYVPTAGYSWNPPHAVYPLAQHPQAYHFSWETGRILQEFQILYIIRGKGSFESEVVGRKDISAGNAFLLFPGIWHRYAPDPEVGWDEYWVGFDGAFARRLVEHRFFTPQDPIYSPGFDAGWQELFNQVIETIQIEPVGCQQVLAALVMQILARLHASSRSAKAGSDLSDTIIRKAKCILAENLEQGLDMKAMANDLHVSYSWFRHTFRHHTGFSPHQYQLQLRINKAKSLLNGTRRPIKDIAAQLGFESPYYFSHLFKKKTGLSPERWRHNARGGGRLED